MSKLPRIKPAKLIKILQKAGFYVDHISGSHHILYKDNKSNAVSVPYHNKDLKLGTFKGILKQAGISVKDFIKFLE